MANGKDYSTLCLIDAKNQIDDIEYSFNDIAANYQGMRGFFLPKMKKEDKLALFNHISELYHLSEAPVIAKEEQDVTYEKSYSKKAGLLQIKISGFVNSFDFTGIRGIIRKLSSAN